MSRLTMKESENAAMWAKMYESTIMKSTTATSKIFGGPPNPNYKNHEIKISMEFWHNTSDKFKDRLLMDFQNNMRTTSDTVMFKHLTRGDCDIINTWMNQEREDMNPYKEVEANYDGM